MNSVLPAPSSVVWRGLVILPALGFLILAWLPAAWLPAGAASVLAFALLLVYPGWLLQALTVRRWALGRTGLAVAVAVAGGLWSLPALALQWFEAPLDWLLAACAGGTLLLAAVAAWQLPPPDWFRRAGWPSGWWRTRPPAARRRLALRLRSPWWCAQQVMFWGAAALALALFARYASIWQPSDRWTYQGIVRFLLDHNTLAAPGLRMDAADAGRLELAPSLGLLAVLVRLAGAPLDAVYNYWLPGLLLFTALCSAFALGRQVLNSRWAAAGGVLLLVVYWLADSALPSLAALSWIERMLLRLEGGQSTLGLWALLGRIVEDKFWLLFVLLPVTQALILRYLQRGGGLLIPGLALAGAVTIHPLGIVLVGLSYAAALPWTLWRRCGRGERVRRGVWLGLVLGVLALLPLLLRQRQFARIAGSLEGLTGQARIDFLPQLGLWTGATSDTFYALHPLLIGQRELLLAALVLLPLLLLLRGLRKPGAQWLLGIALVSALALFNPFVAPLIGQLITPTMLFRTYWLIVLPAVLVVAWAVQTAVVLLRRRGLRQGGTAQRAHGGPPQGRGAAGQGRGRQWGLAAAPLLAAAVLALVTAPKLGAGLRLLGEIQAHALSADDLGLFAFLREQTPPGSKVMAPEWLSNELPALVGDGRGLAFRYYSAQPGGVGAQTEFYREDRLDVARLPALADQKVAWAVTAVGSAADHQLGQLGEGVTVVYANATHRLYALAPGWETQPAAAQLLAAGRALAAGDYAAAAAQAAAARAAAPENDTARQALAAARAAQGDIAGALAALDGLAAGAAQGPGTAGTPPAWVGRTWATVYRQQAALAAAQQDGVAAAAAYAAALAADPQDRVAANGLVRLAAAGTTLAAADAEAALAALHAWTQADAYAPTAFPVAVQQQAALAELAAAYETLGRLPAAEASYQAALALARPLGAEGMAAADLARFLARQGRAEEAQTLLRATLARNINAAPLYTALAELAPDAAAAAAIWREAGAANPLAPWPYEERARAALHMGSRVAVSPDAVAAAIADLRTALTRGASTDAWWLLTYAYQLLDDPAAVRALWEEAVAMQPAAGWPWLGLVEVLRSQSAGAALVTTLKGALAALPEEMAQAYGLEAQLAAAETLAAAQTAAQDWLAAQESPLVPTFVPVERTLASGWTLAGIGAPASLAAGETTPLWIFWQAPDAAAVDAAAVDAAVAGPAAAGWQELAPGLWVQAVASAHNLLPGRAAAPQIPILLPEAGVAPAQTAVITAPRGGATTPVLLLETSLAQPAGGLVTQPQAANTEQVYLQWAALRSEGGSGYLGLRWRDAAGALLGDSFAVMGETSGWRHVAYLHDPPAGAATVELLLRNWQPASRVYFADLMLLELDRPGTEQRVSP